MEPETQPAATFNDFYKRGGSSYVFGPSGDDFSAQHLRGDVELIRAMLSPRSPLLTDKELVDFQIANGKWPDNPIVYGGAHVNAAIAAIAKDLPFEITANKLVIGGQTFEGPEYALVAVVPARAGKYPELLLYAGTGSPGIQGINSGLTRTDAPFVVADAFGPLVHGTWIIGADGIAKAQLGKPLRRVAWRETTKQIAGAKVTFKLFEGTADRDQPMIAEAETGIATALAKLAPARTERPIEFAVVIHPDIRSKKTLTGNGGGGHAVGYARTLHVFAHQGLAYLTTHEATHSILMQIWPPAGSQLIGEGVAVWTTGGYAGNPLSSYRGKLKPRPIKELLAATLRTVPEAEMYPRGGIVVEVAVKLVGLAKVRDHLYGATALTWEAACKAAGTTAAALDAAVAAALE